MIFQTSLGTVSGITQSQGSYQGVLQAGYLVSGELKLRSPRHKWWYSLKCSCRMNQAVVDG